MTTAVTPEEALAKAVRIMDPRVIETWNDLIVKALDPRTKIARIYQKDAIHALALATNVDRETVYANRWLDIEDFYREQGWEVKYDKPAYNEDFEPCFTFMATRRSSNTEKE